MLEGLVDAGAMFLLGHATAGLANGFLNFDDGVGGAGGKGGVATVEH